MILDIKDRWAVVTPGKTGTTSLRSLLCNKVRGCAVSFLPQHHPNVPENVTDRILMVRHPIDRFCSAYYYLLREHAKGSQFAREGIDLLAEQLVANSDVGYELGGWSVWSWTLSKYYERCGITRCYDCTIDGGAALLSYLSETYGYELPSQMPHMRRSKDRAGWRETLDMLTPTNRDAIIAWAQPDFNLKVENLPDGYERA